MRWSWRRQARSTARPFQSSKKAHSGRCAPPAASASSDGWRGWAMGVAVRALRRLGSVRFSAEWRDLLMARFAIELTRTLDCAAVAADTEMQHDYRRLFSAPDPRYQSHG